MTLTPVPDAHLAAQFAADTGPLREMLHRGARRLTRSDADAEDLLQDTLLQAYVGYPKFRQGTNLKAWLFKIMYNRWVSNHRNQQRRPAETSVGEITDRVLARSAVHMSAEAEVLNTVRPVFASHGLSVSQCPSYEQGIVSVETVLMHSSGQWMSSVISAPISKLDAQSVGSAITYCRRYSLAAVAGIAQEDDDANSAVGHSPRQQAKQAKPVISAKQASDLRAALQAAELDEATWCASVRLEALEALTADRFNGALAYLQQQKKEAA